VRSIVGRFLEHSRAYCFINGGREEVFLASADWMTRNLDRRVELMFPVEDPDLRARVRHLLEQCWQDTEKAWVMDAKGVYARVPVDPDRPRLNQQEALIVQATEGEPSEEPTDNR
jgi:polyphosphate kinase